MTFRRHKAKGPYSYVDAWRCGEIEEPPRTPRSRSRHSPCAWPWLAGT